MSRYSLQTECLENIEAFSDEQLASEMAVIESAFDIFEKSILMMELAADTDIVPDCPIFMESFIQEGDGGQGAPSANDNPAPADNNNNNQAPAATDNNNTNTNNNGDAKANENKPMTDAERKAYNKEHWVRMKTKKGKLENIFVSIIAFIPRLLGFLIQSIVKLFKKIGNKDTEKKAQDIANASPEARKKAAEQVGETVDASAQGSAPADNNNNNAANNNPPQGGTAPANNNPQSNPQQPAQNEKKVAGAVNVQKATTTWYDDSVTTAIQGFAKIIKDLDIRANGAEDPQNMEDLNAYVEMFNGVQEQLKADLPPVRQALEEAFKKDWIEVEIGPALDDKKNRMTNAFREVKDAAANLIGGENSKNQNVHGVYSDIVNKLKAIIDKESKNTNAREAGNNKLNSTIQPLKDVVKSIKEMISSFSVRENNLAESYANYSKNIDTVWNALQGSGQQNNYNYQYDPNRAANNNNNNNNNPQGGGNDNNGGQG